jgi:ribose transport system permease protein
MASRFAPLAVLVVLIVLVAVNAPSFATPQTFAVVLADTAALFILAASVTFVILLGAIDLSIQSVASLSSAILAQTLPRFGLFAFVLAIASGLLFGVGSGIVHVRLRVPSFVATLAMGGVAAGLALLASSGRAITIEEAGRANAAWINHSVTGVPIVVLISVVVGVGGFGVLRYSRFGRYCLAIGAGEPAAWAAGVDVERTKIMAFAASGLLVRSRELFSRRGSQAVHQVWRTSCFFPLSRRSSWAELRSRVDWGALVAPRSAR